MSYLRSLICIYLLWHSGSKVIPGYGIHPWWSHLHASSVGHTFQDVIDASTTSELYQALEALSEQRPKQHVVSEHDWRPRLIAALKANPCAIVGEIGIDKAAVIPGSRAKTKLQHQLELLHKQVAIAAEYKRPVSMHCVRAYGHMLELFSKLTPDLCPTKVMLHSYGGSPDEIPKYCKLKGIGDRFFFSFSHAINGRTPEKLMARIAAVPDDRLLIESDQVGVDTAQHVLHLR